MGTTVSVAKASGAAAAASADVREGRVGRVGYVGHQAECAENVASQHFSPSLFSSDIRTLPLLYGSVN